MYLSSIRRLPALFGWPHWSSSCWKVGDLIDYDSLPLDNSCEVEDVSEVLFLSRECIQNNTEDREQVSSSCRSRSRDRDLADSRTTNSSKYGARYIRYQTNTITAPQNESANRVLQQSTKVGWIQAPCTVKVGWIQAPYTKYEIGFRLLAP